MSGYRKPRLTIRNLKYFIVLVVVGGVGLWLLLGGTGAKPQNGLPLSVMTFNVGNYGAAVPTTQQVAGIVRRHGVPDILLVQDVPWPLKIRDLAQSVGLPYYVSGRDTNPRMNMGILSRLALSGPDALRLKPAPGSHTPATFLCAETRINDRTVLICSLHLESLSRQVRRMQEEPGFLLKIIRLMSDEVFRDTERSRNVQAFLTWIDGKQYDEAIIGGDFNTIPLSRTIRTMNRRFEDALWPSLDYFKGTYVKVKFPVKPRIDYIFHSHGFTSGETKVIRETAGDHYPVRAVLFLKDCRT